MSDRKNILSPSILAADALVDLDMRPALVPAGLEVGCVAATAEGTIVLDDDHGRVIGPVGK